MFYVGQKVVCVDADGTYLTLNRIYTVIYLRNGFIGVDDVKDRFGNCGWSPYRFRPVVDDKKEVSFTTVADPESDKWDNRRKVYENN